MKFIFGMKGAQNGNNGRPEFEVKILDIVLAIANILILLALIISITIKTISLFSSSIYYLETFYMELVQLIVLFCTLVATSLVVSKKKNQVNRKIYVCRSVFLANLMYMVILLFGFDLISNLNIAEHLTQVIIAIILAIVLLFLLIFAIITHVKLTKNNKL